MVVVASVSLLQLGDEGACVGKGQLRQPGATTDEIDEGRKTLSVCIGCVSSPALRLLGGYEQVKENRKGDLHLFPPQNILCSTTHSNTSQWPEIALHWQGSCVTGDKESPGQGLSEFPGQGRKNDQGTPGPLVRIGTIWRRLDLNQ